MTPTQSFPSSTAIGRALEDRVHDALNRLQRVGAVREVFRQHATKDRDGANRKLDFSFVLVTPPIDVNITVECKNTSRRIGVSDIDQIRSYKRDIPSRNVFWIIASQPTTASASKLLDSLGIRAFTIEKFENVTNEIEEMYRSKEMKRLLDRFMSASLGAALCGGLGWSVGSDQD